MGNISKVFKINLKKFLFLIFLGYCFKFIKSQNSNKDTCTLTGVPYQNVRI